jgi:hypothetical protein
VISGINNNWQIENNRAYGQFILVRPGETQTLTANLQVMNNYAGTLVVGFYNNDNGSWAYMNPSSRVMVVGNIANTLRVGAYTQLLMSTNLAADVIHGGSNVGTVFGPINNRDV